MNIPEGTTWRTRCGSARITYHSEWDSVRPFVTYKRGTAGAQYASLPAAMQSLRRSGYSFDPDAPAPAGE